MAGLSTKAGSDGKVAGARHSSRSGRGAPRWVYVAGILAVGLVLVVVLMHVTGHGFSHHMPPDYGP